MKIIRWEQLETSETTGFFDALCSRHKGTALTIGGFDGPHFGHESLLNAVLDVSSKSNLASGVVTFTRSPGLNKKPFQYPGDVSTLNLRLGYFSEKGFDFVLLIDFSGEFGKMKGSQFFDILVKTVRMRYVAVGPDFRCGHRLDTGLADISAIAHQEGFRFDSIQQVDLDGQRISSSAIRKAIQSADFALAERLLGHPFLLDFTNSDWKISGKILEIPTSSFTQILPRWGEYCVNLSTRSGKSVTATLKLTDLKVALVPFAELVLPEKTEILTARFRLS